MPYTQKCELLNVSRSSVYYKSRQVEPDEQELALCLMLDKLHIKHPWMGARSLRDQVNRRVDYTVNRKRIQRLMRKMGIHAVYAKPRTSIPGKGHKIYPYLLRHLDINRPNQVWATDITYIPMARGFVYLVAIMDWHSRKVLSWKLSNSMDTSFCIEALEEAMDKYGKPEIFNTDQGSQFTSDDFTSVLTNAGIKISMDGKGRWVDNVFIERIWRSLKYEEVYLKAYESVREARESIKTYLTFYNSERTHQSLDKLTPDEVYFKESMRKLVG
jgi:putative transposase